MNTTPAQLKDIVNQALTLANLVVNLTKTEVDNKILEFGKLFVENNPWVFEVGAFLINYLLSNPSIFNVIFKR